MNPKSLIVATFLFSTVLHVPLYSYLDSLYFPHQTDLAMKNKQSTFTYVPRKRNMRVTKVPRAIVQKLKQSKPIKQIVKKIVPQKKTNELAVKTALKTDADILDELMAIRPKAAVSRIIPPIVDNIDLSNDSIREAFFTYYDLLSTLIARFAVYPEDARLKRAQGVSYVSFLLRQNGSLGDILLKQSSGHGSLDRSALSAVQNAAPFPPLPIELRKDTIRINVPISFEID